MSTAPVTKRINLDERASRAPLALLLGWLVPGGGHFLIGKYYRGALLFVSILGLFLVGLAMNSKIYTLGTDDILDKLGFAGQLGMGGLFFLTKLAGWGSSSATITMQDYGTKFLLIAGLCNVISAIDAHSLASGRKADIEGALF